MSEGETTLADQQGKFTQVVTDGRKVPDIEWIGGRILLSNKRLVLASNEGKRTIPLSKIGTIRGRQDATQPLAQVSNYLSLQVGNDVTLIAPNQHEAFERALYNAVLDRATVAVKHPAVEGGVVQGTDWEKGRLTLELDGEGSGTVALAVASGQFVEIEIDDVGVVEESRAEVLGDDRHVVEAAHTEAGTAVETHVSGSRQTVNVLASLLRKGEQKNTTDVDLSDAESEVLMALYSGVSPFQIPDFVGMDVERVEEIYDQLIETGILEEQRVRREVRLQARGRHIASEAMDEE
ncbi:chemotaxis protein CheF1 [Halobacteriales archaeon QH_7_66_37]|nr:MAG: chemotaxis protein CheF1 [Halobacteriales archaeon QH_7_66_37]